ncbi:MAG: hypothetical protein FWC85_02290 [Elusimicrobia bacterium]|nr:hypothetical protein [Elusimicrobiota bacterium]
MDTLENKIVIPQEKRDYAFWINQLNSAHLREKNWLDLAQKYELRYRSERLKEDFKRYNIFYSNTETLKAALLSQVPQVVIKSRPAKEQAKNTSQKDFYRLASEIIERAVTYNIADASLENEIDALKYDYLITGRGVLWCSFDADLDTCALAPQNEKIIVQHIDFRDFRMSDGKKWKDVWWVARRHILSRYDLVKRFGQRACEVALNYKVETSGAEGSFNASAEVWEIWSKYDKKVYFISPGHKDILEVKEDPYNLTGFYPTPEPLRSIRSNKDLTPIPEFSIYEREASDLSECAHRISRLVNSIKARALYPARFKNQIDTLNSSQDSEFVAVDVGNEISELGGISKVFMYEPIEDKQRVAIGLYEQQRNLVQNIYEITGISDIMRNASPVRETATATSARGKFGSLRLEVRQNQINFYIKEIYKIITELVCELYTAKTLADITSVKLPTQAEKANYKLSGGAANPLLAPEQAESLENFFSKPAWEDIKRYVEDNRLRSFLLDIETSYTIFENDIETRRARMELFTTFSGAVSEAIGVVSNMPELAQVYVKLISFMIDGFKVSRNIKSSIEEAFSEVLEKIKSEAHAKALAEANQNTPEMITAKAETVRAEAQLQRALNDAKSSQMRLALQKAKVIDDIQQNAEDNKLNVKEHNLKTAKTILETVKELNAQKEL